MPEDKTTIGIVGLIVLGVVAIAYLAYLAHLRKTTTETSLSLKRLREEGIRLG